MLADSDQTIKGASNHYFPAGSLKREFHAAGDKRSSCSRIKGRARHHDVIVDGVTTAAAGWSYRAPSPAANQIRGRVTFWRRVHIEQIGATAPGEPGYPRGRSMWQRLCSRRSRYSA